MTASGLTLQVYWEWLVSNAERPGIGERESYRLAIGRDEGIQGKERKRATLCFKGKSCRKASLSPHLQAFELRPAPQSRRNTAHVVGVKEKRKAMAKGKWQGVALIFDGAQSTPQETDRR
jgi:hypothetical protein